MFQSQLRVSTLFLFISKGEFVYQIRREQNHQQQGSVQQLPTPLAVAIVTIASPEDAKDGMPNPRVSARFVSIPTAAAVIARIGADTPRSFSRREGAIVTLIPVAHGYRCYPIPGNHASTGMPAERDTERNCRLIPGGRFCPSRTFA